MATDYVNTSAGHLMARGEHYRIAIGHPALAFAHPLSTTWGRILDWLDRAQWAVPLNRTAPAADATTAVLDLVIYAPGAGHTVGELVAGMTNAATGLFGFGVFVTILSVTAIAAADIHTTGTREGGSSRADAADAAAQQLATADPFRATVTRVEHVAIAVAVLVAVLAVMVGAKGLREWV